MGIDPPPIQEKTADQTGLFPQTWVRWFESIRENSEGGFTGSFANGDGDTVTVVNGKITDVS